MNNKKIKGYFGLFYGLYLIGWVIVGFTFNFLQAIGLIFTIAGGLLALFLFLAKKGLINERR